MLASPRGRRAVPIPFVAVVFLSSIAACTQSSLADRIAPSACRSLARTPLAWESSARLERAPQMLCVSDRLEVITPVREELVSYGIPVATASRIRDCDVVLDAEMFAKPENTNMPVEVDAQWQSSLDGFAWSSPAEAGDGTTFTIFANSTRGVHHGVHALATALMRPMRSATPSGSAAVYRVALAAADWPRFPIRGVIEGYYNRYQSRSERASTMGLMHEVRENTYLYAPKNDPFGTRRWRDPYDGAAAADIAAAAADASRLGIDFVYGISPMRGKLGDAGYEPIQFSNDADVAALIAKLHSLETLGVRRFALLFDDVKEDFVWAADRDRYATLVDAHIDVSNRVAEAVGAPLWFVGTLYSDQFAGWQSYVGALGKKLDPSIEVMLWTGPLVFSKTLSAGELAAVNAALGRQVYIWDNWPTQKEPVQGRSADLYGATPAMMTNATLVGDSGHPIDDFWRVLGPLGSYAWDPSTYDANADYADWQALMADDCR